MHLKTVFPNDIQQWLPMRQPFRDFTRKCWYAETNETSEIFYAGSSTLFYWVFLSIPKRHLFGAFYATCVYTHSTEKKSHAS